MALIAPSGSLNLERNRGLSHRYGLIFAQDAISIMKLKAIALLVLLGLAAVVSAVEQVEGMEICAIDSLVLASSYCLAAVCADHKEGIDAEEDEEGIGRWG